MMRLGKKHMEVASSFAMSAAGFGGAGFVTLLYFTDWRIFVKSIPFYNTKFEGEKTEE